MQSAGAVAGSAAPRVLGRKSQGRAAALDLWRLALAAAVVMVHADFLGLWSPFWGAVLGNGLFRMVVAGFMLISGYYMAGMTAPRFWIWLKRIALLHLIWTAIYYKHWWADTPQTFGGLAWILGVGHFHLWFVPALGLGGICLFLLSGMATRSLLAIAFGLGSAGVVLQYALMFGAAGDFSTLPGGTAWFRNGLLFGLPFLILGLLMGRHRAELERGLSDRQLWQLFTLGAVCITLEAALMAVLLGPKTGIEIPLFVYLLAPSGMLLVARQQLAPALGARGKDIALLSSGVYFIHVHVLVFLSSRAGLEGLDLALFGLLGALVLGGGLIWVNRRVPIL